jgi:hypothetical protein
MAADRSSPEQDRFQLALELYETGEAMMRQRLLRENPGLSPEAVEEKLVEWLRTRPGARHGDASGRPGIWPRRRAG